MLTADRPPEWIDQLDGQTIRQQNVYGQHIKQRYTFPVDFSHPDALWHSERMVSEALNKAVSFPAGPVHINVPLREPFYPAPGEEVNFNDDIKIIEEEQNSFGLSQGKAQQLQQELQQYNRILVVAGQDKFDQQLLQSLEKFVKARGAVAVGDIISNVQQSREVVRYQDAIFSSPDEEKLSSLQPDLLITFGKSIISKSLKLYLRKHKPKEHWHIQPAGDVADTFQTLTRIIRCTPAHFFTNLADAEETAASTYPTVWQDVNKKAGNFLQQHVSEATYSELAIVARVLQALPQQSHLHLANSMSVRYANILALQPTQQVQVYANRGTSGIDGSNSTAVGCALVSSGITTLLTGDLAFFYDRNGLWHNYLPQNLRIVLLNNHAGGIFRLIDGPKQQPELEPFFETHQALNAKNTARDFNLNYTPVHSIKELEEVLPAFFSVEAGAGILEVFTDSPANADAFATYRQEVRKIKY